MKLSNVFAALVAAFLGVFPAAVAAAEVKTADFSKADASSALSAAGPALLRDSVPGGSEPTRSQYDWEFDNVFEDGETRKWKFRAYSPDKSHVCADAEFGNHGPLTNCDMVLNFHAGDDGWFNDAELKFTDKCNDDALIDVAYLSQWRWVKCRWWNISCGFDGGYWEAGPSIEYGVGNNGKSWCLGDDPNAWKQYSQCGSQCLSDCGEGYWVPSKTCTPSLLFRKDGTVV